MKKSTILLFVLLIQMTTMVANGKEGKRWSEEKASKWYATQPWLVGCNFIPSTAINQLEMWQEDTFDPETIDRELGWAEGLGFNIMRVFLHSYGWKQDPEGFKKRIGQYLDIADNHGIRTILVFFDDCWVANSKPGKQPEPKLGVHNSGWIQDPSCDLRKDTATLYPWLEMYVKDIITTFKNDERVVAWDLYNEPGNYKHGNESLPLLKNVFKWGREVNPSQPLTAGIWAKFEEMNKFQLENSDIITYHNYSDEVKHKAQIDDLKRYNRPLVCTEYMARTLNSRFENILPLLKKENVGAINWGLVAGKTNTIYAWEKPIPDGSEPDIWFCDIFRSDGSKFDPAELHMIKKLTGKSD